MVTIESVEVCTEDEIGYVNLSPQVEAVVRKSGIRNGTVTVQAPYCVDSITHMEFEPGSQIDLKDWFEKHVPTNAHCVHEDYNHDNNGHSHLRATLLGASEMFVIKDGEILLNRWQQIILIGMSPRGAHVGRISASWVNRSVTLVESR